MITELLYMGSSVSAVVVVPDNGTPYPIWVLYKYVSASMGFIISLLHKSWGGKRLMCRASTAIYDGAEKFARLPSLYIKKQSLSL